jgi:hypothetical protein
VDDALAVRVLHGVADLREQLQPLAIVSWFLSQYSTIGSPLTRSITK